MIVDQQEQEEEEGKEWNKKESITFLSRSYFFRNARRLNIYRKHRDTMATYIDYL